MGATPTTHSAVTVLVIGRAFIVQVQVTTLPFYHELCIYDACMVFYHNTQSVHFNVEKTSSLIHNVQDVYAMEHAVSHH